MRQLNRNCISYVVLLLIAVLLQACGGSGGGSSNGKYGYGDGPPAREVDVSNLPDAVPKVEPIRKAGNKSPYTVLGRTYQVLPSSQGHKERGVASWYGKKFHGRKTSNGEIYDMYAMTAAHKSLPIPSYVKVTNLDNGRTVVVRVNDRGPFHSGRIIDLSYAAAKKLNYSDKGVANVEVVAIDPRTYKGKNNYQKQSMQQTSTLKQNTIVTANSAQVSSSETYLLPNNTYLQVGAFNTEVAATNLSGRVQSLSSYPVVVRYQEQPLQLFKVLIGPVKNNLKLLDLRNLLRQAENLSSFVVYE